MKTNEIRQTFLNFFKDKGHVIEKSSPLIPYNDPSLLFTNSGMVPFKNIFLGNVIPRNLRVASSQTCVRAGGKHNDLENVGYTSRHNTFFEMLGNFSFGDYFKHEAIQWAWEFIIQILKIPKERIWITVYKDDEETANIWLNDIGIPSNKLSHAGAKDNFWSMGDTGPCGPCTEIFYDHGAEMYGNPPGIIEENGDRYTEIWNLVFMQYNRDENRTLHSLPRPSVDTGMGLERIAAVMQGLHSNYDIDSFKNLIVSAKKLTNCTDFNHPSLKVIADHIRACAFLIADGVLPSNEGRGYVLRRILRRALRHGHKLGCNKPFFFNLVEVLIKEMSDTYPVLISKQKFIEKSIFEEEQQFLKTLQQGLQLLEREIVNIQDNQKINGDVVFKLYDTYGFPFDLTADVAREHNLFIDETGFKKAMAKQQEESRSANKHISKNLSLNTNKVSQFLGYNYKTCTAHVLEIYNQDSQRVSDLQKGQIGFVICDKTTFYPESGGQLGDTGFLLFNNGTFLVQDTQKMAQAIVHIGYLKHGHLKTSMTVETCIDCQRREAININHSSTHLLHATLRSVLGKHVQQQGSLVTHDKLRFDFTHQKTLTQKEIQQIENIVNEHIRKNTCVNIYEMTVDQAMKKGVLALFNEKYANKVRVLSMAENFSMELCCGTHVQRTGDIGLFKIVSENGISSGVRRIEAITGAVAFQLLNNAYQTIRNLTNVLSCSSDFLEKKLEKQNLELKQARRDIEKLQSQTINLRKMSKNIQPEIVGNLKLIAQILPNGQSKLIRKLIDFYKNQFKSVIIVIGCETDGKVQLGVGVTKDLSQQISSSELVNYLARFVGGKGGGRVDIAMAGGRIPNKLSEAINAVKPWLLEK